MTKNKKAQRARRSKTKDEFIQSLRSSADSVVEMIRDMPGLALDALDVDKAILAAPDYNYYEKLMLHHIHNTAREAQQLMGNYELARQQDVEEMRDRAAALRGHMQWLINTTESINAEDTAWSDLVSEVLQFLHAACDAAGEYGPAWLEYSWDDLDDAAEGYKAAAAAQLEREGLAIRKRKLFTATRRRRWGALEQQMNDDEAEEEENEAQTNFGTAANASHLDPSFRAAALADATTFAADAEDDAAEDLLFPLNDLTAASQGLAECSSEDGEEDHEEVLAAQQEGYEAAARGDVYAAMAADVAAYAAQCARQQQQQQQPGFAIWGQPPPPPPPRQQQLLPPNPQQRPQYDNAFPALSGQQQQQQQPVRPPRPASAPPGDIGAADRSSGRSGGRVSAVQAYAAQQEERQRQERLEQERLERERRRQQQQQQSGAGTKVDPDPPANWTPEFAGRSEPERVFNDGDYLPDETSIPDNLSPVLTRSTVAQHAILARVALESVVMRRRGFARSQSRTGVSPFIANLRTDPDMTAYEKVMVNRWWRSLCRLVHHDSDDRAQLLGHLSSAAQQRRLQEELSQVRAAEAWINLHLQHLMPDPPASATLEQQEATQRLHKAATLALEALARNGSVSVRQLLVEVSLDLQPQCRAEDGGAHVLTQRTVALLVSDGLAERFRNMLVGRLMHRELQRAVGFTAG